MYVMPKEIRRLIKENAPINEIADALQNEIERRFPDPDHRPTLRQVVKAILPDIRRWANPSVDAVVEAFVLSKSTDPLIADKYAQKLAQYRSRYEAVEARFAQYE